VRKPQLAPPLSQWLAPGVSPMGARWMALHLGSNPPEA
jgi:hypothetical protein